MFSVLKFSLFFTLVLSVHSLATPRARSAHIHHAIAARAPVPVAEPAPALRPWTARRKRAGRTRCGAPKSSSQSISPAAAPPSNDAAGAVVAAGAAPSDSSTTVSSSTVQPATPTSTQVVVTPVPTQPGGGEIFSGDMTYYDAGLGACGITNTNNDFIVAASAELFDSFGSPGGNPNLNPICNRKLRIFHNGKSVDATVTDRCAGCTIRNSLDLTPAAFNVLEDPAVGRTTLTWQWL